jgi:hypothetical protein
MTRAADGFSCRATLAIGKSQENLATRHFPSASEAADWALLTAQQLKLSLGASAYDKIDDELVIEIRGHVADDPKSEQLLVFAGSLSVASAKLAESVVAFERHTLPQFRLDVGKRAARIARRRYWTAAAGAGILVAAVVGVWLMPPILDPERVAEEMLSGPPPKIAGRWAIGDPATNCETNYIEFSRRRYEAVVGTRRQNFVAAYAQPSPDTMRVEYAQGGIRLAQMFRLSPQTGLLTIVSVESSEPEIRAAARAAIGTTLAKCPS